MRFTRFLILSLSLLALGVLALAQSEPIGLEEPPPLQPPPNPVVRVLVPQGVDVIVERTNQ